MKKGTAQLNRYWRQINGLRGKLPAPERDIELMRKIIGTVVGDIIFRKRGGVAEMDETPFVYGMETYEEELIAELEELGVKLEAAR